VVLFSDAIGPFGTLYGIDIIYAFLLETPLIAVFVSPYFF